MEGFLAGRSLYRKATEEAVHYFVVTNCVRLFKHIFAAAREYVNTQSGVRIHAGSRLSTLESDPLDLSGICAGICVRQKL